MKIFSVLALIVFASFNGREHEVMESNTDPGDILGNITGFDDNHFPKNKEAFCSLSGNFSAVLQTRTGGFVSVIQPNTSYRIQITGPAGPPPGTNGSYCMVASSGFVEFSKCNDTDVTSGINNIFVTTSSVLPPFIYADIGPSCNGSTIPDQTLRQLFIS